MKKPKDTMQTEEPPLAKDAHTEFQVMAPEAKQYVGPVINPEDPVGLFKLAIECKAGADTLERVMAVRRELRAEAAKKAYDEAMAEFQDRRPTITKTKAIPDKSGKVAMYYAPLEVIVATVKPLLKELGFSYSFDTDVESQPGWVIAKCKVTHCQGHSELSTAKFPLGTKTQIMSDTQNYAAALTFASRRVFCNAFGIVTEGEDRDGGVKPKPEGPSTLAPEHEDARALVKELWNLLAEHRGTEPNWNKANEYLFELNLLKDDEPAVQRLPAKRIAEIIHELKEGV